MKQSLKLFTLLTALFLLPTRVAAEFEPDPSKIYTINESDEWFRVQYKKNIKAGSALDFSGMGLQDAPAGKYGKVIAVGGHFEFEGKPGVEQRFYGVNLCQTANYPSHEQTKELLDRLVRLGYNSIRIHHHDNYWSDESNQERLDYLLSEAIKRGLYITTDLYVSRRVKWSDVGYDKEGYMVNDDYKILVGCNEVAFKDWCAFTESFLCHVNKYNGKAYKDEPALAFISLINEGKLSAGYRHLKDDESMKAMWKRFCAELKAAGDPNGDIFNPDETPKIWSEPYKVFQVWFQKDIFKRCSAYIRSLGCNALLTTENNGDWGNHREGRGATPLFDYVDDHFYVDHPKFPNGGWRLPSSLPNENPILVGEPKFLYTENAVGASKPYAITEWNFSGPGKYRAIGGIMTGTMASIMGWDGLWRFTYTHHRDNIDEDPTMCKQISTTYFDLGLDPLSQASDRAVICLFLRKDADPGTIDGIHLKDAGEVFQRDTVEGSLSIVTPRTCGVFSPDGPKTAGPLSVDVSDNPATVWVSSLDENSIEQSSRILLVHLTDIQGRGTRYATDERKMLLRWGTCPLLEKGSANISLKLDKPSAYTVYELDTSGDRVRKIKTKATKTNLTFIVNTENPMGMGRMYYEIVR